MNNVDYEFDLRKYYSTNFIYIKKEDIVGYLRKLALENPSEIDVIKFLADSIETIGKY